MDIEKNKTGEFSIVNFRVEKECGRFRAVFEDGSGMSIIYRGSKKKCEEYIDRQKRKLSKGRLIHVSESVFKVV